MSELELELEVRLRDLASGIEFPETPDLASAVRTPLETPRRWHPSRRALAIALAVLAVAIAGVLAVPSARTAILEWLGIRGVRLEFVDKLPPRRVTRNLDLGDQTTLAVARRSAGFDVVAPPGDLGRPLVYFRVPPLGGMVSFLYGKPGSIRLVISEFRGDYRPFIQKTLSNTTAAVPSTVDGQPAIWLEDPHVVEYADESGTFQSDLVRIADRVLLWRHGDLTFRLEGDLTREQAIEIAEATT
jgi:hypothetical protein